MALRGATTGGPHVTGPARLCRSVWSRQAANTIIANSGTATSDHRKAVCAQQTQPVRRRPNTSAQIRSICAKHPFCGIWQNLGDCVWNLENAGLRTTPTVLAKGKATKEMTRFLDSVYLRAETKAGSATQPARQANTRSQHGVCCCAIAPEIINPLVARHTL